MGASHRFSPYCCGDCGNVLVRIPQPLLDTIAADLRRPHAFAYERVGFAVVGTSRQIGLEPIFCVNGYMPVAEDGYDPSDECGALINSRAIRVAMQLAMDTRQCVVHVHSHDYSERPGFSSIDESDHEGLVRSFRNLGINQPYGAMLLGDRGFLMRIWLPGASRFEDTRHFRIVGPHTWIGRR